jgi:hypothetical protein
VIPNLILGPLLCVLSDFAVKKFFTAEKKEEAQRSAEGICHVLMMLILYLILVLFLCVLCDFAVSIFFTAEKKGGGAEIRRGNLSCLDDADSILNPCFISLRPQRLCGEHIFYRIEKRRRRRDPQREFVMPC